MSSDINKTNIVNPKFITRVGYFLNKSKGLALQLTAIILIFFTATILLIIHTMDIRLQRDLVRLALKDRLDILESARLSVTTSEQALSEVENAAGPQLHHPYLVLSLMEKRLWFKKNGEVLFTAPVAVGSGRILDREEGGAWKIPTPRGRMVVQAKDENPVWVPPDWHYVEESRKRNLKLIKIESGQSIAAADGSTIELVDDHVVRTYPDGKEEIMKPTKGDELIVDDKMIMPPLGSPQRRYQGVMGYYRLSLGNGYAVHGTNNPDSIGRAVSHGCVRLLNEDIEKLYPMVPVGTPIYIY